MKKRKREEDEKKEERKLTIVEPSKMSRREQIKLGYKTTPEREKRFFTRRKTEEALKRYACLAQTNLS